jgi:hypothetical protein
MFLLSTLRSSKWISYLQDFSITFFICVTLIPVLRDNNTFLFQVVDNEWLQHPVCVVSICLNKIFSTLDSVCENRD